VDEEAPVPADLTGITILSERWVLAWDTTCNLDSPQLLGSFAGEVTANTDGIWLGQGEIPGLDQGSLFALHDDGGLAAFAWEDIGEALGLRTGCPTGGIEPN
jgi:hypothetical protein